MAGPGPRDGVPPYVVVHRRDRRDAGVANCVSHAADWETWDHPTGPLVYLRLHGAPRTYSSAYGPKKLAAWTKRIERWRRQGRDVFVYFDNDAEGAAFRDAAHLQELVPGGRPRTG